MAAQTYYFTSSAGISCDSCRNVAAGDQVDIALRQDLIPALPVSVRAVVQLVDGLIYSLEYDDADLLGAAIEIADPIVASVTCVSELVRSKEYSDAKDAIQDNRLTNIEGSLAALGVVPSDNDGAFVVHPDSTIGVSVESVRHDTVTVPPTVGDETIILDPSALSSPLAVLDLTGKLYRISFEVSVISSKAANDRDSAAEFLLVGGFNTGATAQTVSLMEKDGVSITGTRVGNNFHINIVNTSTASVTAFVTSKFRILS